MTPEDQFFIDMEPFFAKRSKESEGKPATHIDTEGKTSEEVLQELLDLQKEIQTDTL